MIKFVVMLGWGEGCGSPFLFGLSLYQIESTLGEKWEWKSMPHESKRELER